MASAGAPRADLTIELLCGGVPVAAHRDHTLSAGLPDQVEQPLPLVREVAPVLVAVPGRDHLDRRAQDAQRSGLAQLRGRARQAAAAPA